MTDRAADREPSVTTSPCRLPLRKGGFFARPLTAFGQQKTGRERCLLPPGSFFRYFLVNGFDRLFIAIVP